MSHSHLRQISLLCGAAATLLWCSVAQAERPTKDESTGLIYFSFNQDIFQMKADGSEKTALNLGAWGAPSYKLHGGGRWFLIRMGASLTAMKEDGETVSLFTLPPPDPDGRFWRISDGDLRWVFDGTNEDGAVSWQQQLMIRAEDGTTEVLAEEVVRASLVYDTKTGDVSGIDSDSIERFPDIRRYYDWSPDGSMIVFNDQGILWLFDTQASAENPAFTPLPIAQVFGPPEWSPDGVKIAYGIVDREQDISRIETFNLLNSSVTGIAEGRLQSPLDGIVVFLPHWSPDSSALVYQLQNVRGYSDTTHIIKKSASGKGKATNLTADLDVAPVRRPWIYGWRSK